MLKNDTTQRVVLYSQITHSVTDRRKIQLKYELDHGIKQYLNLSRRKLNYFPMLKI